jgi:hypothetical protein
MRIFKFICPLYLVLISFIGSSKMDENPYTDGELKLFVRMLGDKVLLDMAKDSTSRVLPVQSLGKYEYLLTFNTPFKLNPDLLVEIVKTLVEESDMVNSFIVEVFEPSDTEATYSFKIDPQGLIDMIACRTRDYPVNSYSIKLKILSFKRKEVSDAQKTEAGFGTLWPVIIGFILFGILVLVYLKNKLKKESLKPEEVVQIGNYQVNFVHDELHFGQERVELTSKESNLLRLLYQHMNATVARDEILHEVWGDEGDYVGRTLDVFISKLRKKLDKDEAVKILNARGVGYKLVVG